MSKPITVYDRVPCTAQVTPAQAIAYLRRRLVKERGWTEHVQHRAGDGPIFHAFQPRNGWQCVLVPLRDDFADYERRFVELITELVELKIEAQPSVILLSMVAEVVE